jgi:hypothetical protein
MAPTPESESLFERLKAWDAEAVAVELSKDPSLWSAAARKDVRLGSRQEVAWMLGEVAPTPLSVAVRLARKDDRKKGAEMVRKMLEVLEVGRNTLLSNQHCRISFVCSFSLLDANR